MKKENVIGKKFAKLTVVEEAEKGKNGKARCKCHCECGKIVILEEYRVKSGHTKSCGCLKKQRDNIEDLAGQKFKKLTVLKLYGRRRTKGGQIKIRWLCRCDCGNKKVVDAGKLKSGHYIGCGCSIGKTTKHRKGKESKGWSGCGDISGSIWCRIKHNAKNNDHELKIDLKYIWDLFLKQNRKCALSGLSLYFAKNSKEFRQGKTTASLDRIDSSKGYEIGNVQWVHRIVNIMKSNHDEDFFCELCGKIYKKRKNR
jgi:hypothetical protein